MSYYLFRGRDLVDALDDLRPNNRQAEYYITDVPGMLASQGKEVRAVPILKPCEALGVNTLDELAAVEQEMHRLRTPLIPNPSLSSPSMNSMKLFAGRAHPALARRICEYLGLPLGRAVMGNFPDGEISCKIDEDVRGRDVFIVQPTCPPVNENLMELLIMIESFKRASAERITAVIPYFGYARQDRKDEGPRADYGQVGGESDYPGGRRPRVDHGSAHGPNPGLFRHPGRPPLCRAGHRRTFQVDEPGRQRVRGRQSGRREHQAGAGAHGPARRPPGHHRQTPQQRREDQAGQRDRTNKSRATCA